MNGIRIRVAGDEVIPPDGWVASWLDRGRGIVRLRTGDEAITALVEGAAGEWVVTLRGRRVGVLVQSWREQLLSEAEEVAGARSGPSEVRAALPGLVAAVAVSRGSEVAAGEALLTIEAMKMQNEVRAPRAGVVAEVAVEAGQTVTSGALLVRLD